MRKILLATTALVAFAGAAQAAESPIQVTLGGSVDFRAALFNEADQVLNNKPLVRSRHVVVAISRPYMTSRSLLTARPPVASNTVR